MIQHGSPSAFADPIEVPDEKGVVSPLPFGSCSVDQLRRALHRKRMPASSKPLTPEAEAQADQYREAVRSRLPQGGLIKVTVRNHKERAASVSAGEPAPRRRIT